MNFDFVKGFEMAFPPPSTGMNFDFVREFEIVFPPPLILAIREGQDYVTMLLERGEDVNQHDRNGLTALYHAVEYGHTEIVKVLLKFGADHSTIKYRFNYTVLMMAAEKGKTDIVKILLEHGADHSVRASGGSTALIIAVIAGHGYVAETLIKYGADHSATQWGSRLTALMFAVSRGYEDIVRMLLLNGADHTAVSAYGLTALGMAIAEKKVACALVLKRYIIQRIVDIYIAMLPLEQPVYQVWWIMEFVIGGDTLLLSEKSVIKLLQGIRNSYNALKLQRLTGNDDDGE
jgi:ankyrin repeat protein